MKFRNLILSLCAAIAMVAACENNDPDMTWSRGKFVTDEADRTPTWELNENLAAVTVQVEGTASGVTSREAEYTTMITSPLVFDGQCVLNGADIASGETKSIEVEGWENAILVNNREDTGDNSFRVYHW